MLIDTHCHIQFKVYDKDLEEVLSRCSNKGVIMNAVGTQKKTSERAVCLAEKFDNIFASVGLHPIQEYKQKVEEEEFGFITCGEEFDIDYYTELAGHEKVIGIGETGMDKFHVPINKQPAEVLEEQRKLFYAHAKIAEKLDLPLVIHVRDAHPEMIDAIKEMKTENRGVVHCFSGSWMEAREYLDAGYYLGFTGIITFPAKKKDSGQHRKLMEVLEKVPINRILIETDAPYLAPQRYRGKRSEPWMVEEVLKKIAEIRKISEIELGDIINHNALNIFTKLNEKIS